MGRCSLGTVAELSDLWCNSLGEDVLVQKTDEERKDKYHTLWSFST